MAHPHPTLITTREGWTEAEIFGLADPYTQVEAVTLDSGLSGATIERVTLGTGTTTTTRIIKWLDPATNWLMRASDDTQCREVQLTQSEFWRRMPHVLLLPIVAAGTFPDGMGALAMTDMDGSIYPASMCYDMATPDPALVAWLIDGLAMLHAAFWADPALSEATWLASPAATLFTLTPDRLSRSGVDADDIGYGGAAIRMWGYLERLIDPDDYRTIIATLAHPDALLAAYAACPATLAHGDAWLANMGTQEGRLILLDWALATRGPATLDSLWLAHTWHSLEPSAILVAHRAALLRHGVAAVADDATWDLIEDLGWLRTTFMGIEWLIRDVRGAQDGDEQSMALDRLRYWCHSAADILRTRGW